jgi:ubiquinone/menaquinone biosynthesis C-methylase UbiE
MPKYKKDTQNFYVNKQPLMVDYEGSMKKRNQRDPEFYKTRYKIIQAETEKQLIPILTRLSEKFPQPLLVLDAGCGDGLVLNTLSSLSKKLSITLKLYGIDLDSGALKLIKHKADLRKGSITKIPYPKNKFNLVTSKDVIEHLTKKDLITSVGEVYRVLKPGGIYYCDTPNPESLLAKTMANNWWMFIEPQHITLVPPKVLKKVFLNAGFKKVKAFTRAEIDEQIDEVREILHRKNLFIFNTLLKPVRHRLMRYYISFIKEESITICVGEK